LDLRGRKWRKFGEDYILRNFYASLNIVRLIKSRTVRTMRHVAQIEEVGSTCNVMDGKPEERSPLGRPRLRWEDNIRMDPR
jgi:hypothetical protein